MQKDHISKASTTSTSKSLKPNSNREGRKRKRISASDDEGEEDREEEVIPDLGDEEDLNLDRGFACPYRKYCPSKYNVTDWAPYALTSRPTIARVKFVAPASIQNSYNTKQLQQNPPVQVPLRPSMPTLQWHLRNGTVAQCPH